MFKDHDLSILLQEIISVNKRIRRIFSNYSKGNPMPCFQDHHCPSGLEATKCIQVTFSNGISDYLILTRLSNDSSIYEGYFATDKDSGKPKPIVCDNRGRGHKKKNQQKYKPKIVSKLIKHKPLKLEVNSSEPETQNIEIKKTIPCDPTKENDSKESTAQVDSFSAGVAS